VIPDKTIDPWEAINPYKMWLLVILISGLSFVGYVATKWFGQRKGISLTGLFGGLVSSTAVTLSFARQSKESSESVRWMYVLSAGLLIAWSVMFFRILIEVAVVNRSLLTSLLVPMISMAVLAGVMAFFYYRKEAEKKATKDELKTVPLRNPFSLISALKFAGLFAIVLLAVKYVQLNYPGEGFYIVAALAGLTDVDAITLSMAEYAKSGDPKIAVRSITIAAVANTIVKCGFVLVLGQGRIKTLIAIATAIILAAGLSALIFI
jgi:uncharacterized membrane protein (DUF4010 family)